MLRNSAWTIALMLLAGPALAGEGKYAIKQADSPPPKELSDPVRNLLAGKSIQFLDGSGLQAELWFRTHLPAKATPEQVKNGLTYRELEESTLLGAVRFEQTFSDYRKQKIKPGVYTLRFGMQPMDGDHMGTAPHGEFCLLIPASADRKPDPMETKELREQSSKASGGTHPAVMLLFPNDKPEDAPRLVEKGMGNWVLALREPVSVNGQKAAIGIGLTLVGHTTAE